MKNPQIDPSEIQGHMLGTYHSVRLGVSALGLVLALSLLGPWVDGLPLRGSMSAYYYSPMRNVFVGVLVATGALLYLYKGFSSAENLTLNLAGLLAVGVAWLPTAAEGTERNAVGFAHLACAVVFFLCIGYVSVFRAGDTLSLIKDPTKAKRLQRLYRVLGAGMVASPLFALLASALLDPRGNNRSIVFYIEAAGVVMFAVYWLAKSREMRETGADVVAAAALMKKVASDAKRTAPGNVVVAEHSSARAEMEDDLARQRAAPPPAAGGKYPSSDRLGQPKRRL
jgi:hypothetical protein